jgi:hypothetical protein
MFSKIRARLTYANVVATLALFVALGGSSYAAIKITGKNVKNSSLTGRDIKNSSLTTSDVKNRSLLAKDFKTGQLPAGQSGTPGAKGDPGPTFGDAVQVGTATVARCDDTTVASYPVTLDRPARIFATGQATYRKSGDRPENGALQVVLRNAAGTVDLAQTTEVADGSLAEASSDNSANGVSASGVLMTNENAPTSTHVYVGPAGTYKLALVAFAEGNCGTTDPRMDQIQLSHVVLGTG